MEKDRCGWAGCKNASAATLDGRSFCRIHFYEFALKRLEDSRSAKEAAATTGNPAIARFLSELVSQATALVAGAEYLTEMQRNQFLELSLSAAELYKRLQRNPRFERKLSVVLRRSDNITAEEQKLQIVLRSSPDTSTWGEFTNTLNVSKTGGCFESSSAWEVSQEFWIERADNRQVTRARVVWIKKVSSSKYLLGAEILNCENFWGLE